jgi:ribosomal-protein-alanine N-acetyltransferase
MPRDPVGCAAEGGAISVELRTPRLRLRPLAPADGAALHRLWTHPDVRRFLWDDRVIAPADVDGVIGASAATFAAEGFGHFALREDEAGPLFGTCGLHRYASGAEPELLYSLARERWGRGLATEAARAVIDDAFARLGFARVVARADVPNRDSQRVMQRLGMAYTGEEEAGGLRLVRYVLARSS